MTEITVLADKIDQEKIHWGVFILALVLAPPIVAILGIWAYGIPVFALGFGIPTYVLFGAPAFALAINRFRARALGLAAAGFVANLVSFPAIFAFAQLSGESDSLGFAVFIAGFGCIFATLWGLAFGIIYRSLIKE